MSNLAFDIKRKNNGELLCSWYKKGFILLLVAFFFALFSTLSCA